MFSQLLEKQRDGRNKDTIVNKNYIESGEYRKKFNNITNDKVLNRLLYNCAKEMLLHRSGTSYEDMYWIDPSSKKIIASETNQSYPGRIVYSRATQKSIKKYNGLITIHNHPSGFPPSVEDFNSNYTNKYQLGIICAHNGKIFCYYATEIINNLDASICLKKYLKMGYDDYNAQRFMIIKLAERYSISFEEVF